MYFCRRCLKWHKTGAIARSHRIYAQKRQKRPLRRKRLKPKPILLIKRKPLKKAKTGFSRMRKGQLKYRMTDPWERKEVERIRRKSGMTHIQTVNLWRKAHEHDVDIESMDFGLGGDRPESYEFANKELNRMIDPMKHRSIRDLSAEMQMYGF